MKALEIPLVFDCQGSELIGMLHLPSSMGSRGMISVVAGGPQYRGGVARLQVQMARELAAGGVPVMRFDHRGLGDSEGRFRGYVDLEADLAAAIQAFRQQVPAIKEIVMWGGCDAASAIMINAWKYPEVSGVVLGNPWVHSEQLGDAVAVKHYRQRLSDQDFWLKLMRMQYNPLPALSTLARNALARLGGAPHGQHAGGDGAAADDPAAPTLPRMRIGLSRFRGDALLLMSGRSVVSQEFDELIAGNPAWQTAMRSPRQMRRHDIPGADQTFSTAEARAEVNAVLLAWILDPQSDPARALGGSLDAGDDAGLKHG